MRRNKTAKMPLSRVFFFRNEPQRFRLTFSDCSTNNLLEWARKETSQPKFTQMKAAIKNNIVWVVSE